MTATPMASLKPLRNIPPRRPSRTRVTAILLFIHTGVNGFCAKWAAASAAESVMVMTKSVVATPSRIVFPVRQQRVMQEQFAEGNGHYDRVKAEVKRNQYDRDANGLLKTFEEYPAQEAE